MKVGYVAPETNVSSDVAVIESNSGIKDFKPEVPEPSTKAAKNKARLEDGKKLVREIAKKEKKRQVRLANFAKIANTEIKNMTNLKSLDFMSKLPLDKVDFHKLGLPNPEDYGKTREEVLDMSNVDGESWPLPKPELAKIDPKCFDTDDMYLGSFMSLDGMDMRGWDLPSFDFSWAKDWDFPDWMDSSSVPSGDIFDFSSFDLNGIIDLDGISLPDWNMPDFDMPDFGGDGMFDFGKPDWLPDWNMPDIDLPDWGGGSDFDFSMPDWMPDWDLDCNFEFDGLKGIFDGMGSDGDLFGMSSLATAFNGIGCLGTSLGDLLNPSAITDCLSNFSLDGLTDMFGGGGLGDFDLGGLLDGDVDLKGLFGKLDLDGFDKWGLSDKLFDWLDKDKGTKGDGIDLDMGMSDIKTAAVTALSYLGEEWWWYDKKQKKYHYDNLSKVSPYLLYLIKDEPNYKDIVHMAISLRMHRYHISGI